MEYKNLFSCENRTAIVTGGSGLIGREIVKGLAQYGAQVYIADQNEDAARALFSDNIKFIYLDITDEQSVCGALQQIAMENDKIDILVNCAYPRTKDWGAKFENVKFESWKQNVDDHLGGYFLMCKEAARNMKEHGGGSIINLSSTYGVVAPDFSIYEGTEMTMPAAYSPIKAGIIAMTKYIATYFASDGVRANTISPGGIFDNQAPSFVEKYSQKTPMGRMGKPHEIVGAVIFLASDASTFVTGQNILVDGGWTAW
ncbi:MAG TPA: oxidoreductase [Paludibacter sp.]|nr:oxidoreductase [Paludibacter sp.]HPM10136.1 oxidoreductase [Paludibacter sp.]